MLLSPGHPDSRPHVHVHVAVLSGLRKINQDQLRKLSANQEQTLELQVGSPTPVVLPTQCPYTLVVSRHIDGQGLDGGEQGNVLFPHFLPMFSGSVCAIFTLGWILALHGSWHWRCFTVWAPLDEDSLRVFIWETYQSIAEAAQQRKFTKLYSAYLKKLAGPVPFY